MSGKLSPITNAIIVNGVYNSNGPYLRDINPLKVISVIKTTALDVKDQKIDVYEVTYQESNAKKNTVFVFPAGGATLTDYKTFFESYNSNINYKIYSNLLAIDFNDITATRDVLLNEDYIRSRLLNGDGNTDIYVNMVLAKDKKIFTFSGDQTNTAGGEYYVGPGSIQFVLTSDNTGADEYEVTGTVVGIDSPDLSEVSLTFKVDDGDPSTLDASDLSSLPATDTETGAVVASGSDGDFVIDTSGVSGTTLYITMTWTYNGYDYSDTVTITL